jgi:hypothetical protein
MKYQGGGWRSIDAFDIIQVMRAQRSLKTKRRSTVIEDAWLIALGVVAAGLIVRTDIVHLATTSFQGFAYIGSFIAGIFFTSAFTVAPSAVILGELAQREALLIVALCGGLGATFGDYVLFRFVRDRVADDLNELFSHPKAKRIWRLFYGSMPRFVWPFLGALIIASPLPDEIGIALLGLSRVNDRAFLFISFILNSAGILIVGLAARAIF